MNYFHFSKLFLVLSFLKVSWKAASALGRSVFLFLHDSKSLNQEKIAWIQFWYSPAMDTRYHRYTISWVWQEQSLYILMLQQIYDCFKMLAKNSEPHADEYHEKEMRTKLLSRSIPSLIKSLVFYVKLLHLTGLYSYKSTWNTVWKWIIHSAWKMRDLP